jgi:hypothetical protein
VACSGVNFTLTFTLLVNSRRGEKHEKINKIFFSSPKRPDRPWSPFRPLFNGYRGYLPPGEGGRNAAGCVVTTHLPLEWVELYLFSPRYPFMARAGTTLIFFTLPTTIFPQLTPFPARTHRHAVTCNSDSTTLWRPFETALSSNTYNVNILALCFNSCCSPPTKHRTIT